MTNYTHVLSSLCYIDLHELLKISIITITIIPFYIQYSTFLNFETYIQFLIVSNISFLYDF